MSLLVVKGFLSGVEVTSNQKGDPIFRAAVRSLDGMDMVKLRLNTATYNVLKDKIDTEIELPVKVNVYQGNVYYNEA